MPSSAGRTRGPICSTPAARRSARGLWDYVKENADYPYYLIRDRFAGAEGRSLRAVKRGQGKIIEHDGANGGRLSRPRRRRSRCARRSARTWAASSRGTQPSARGTARATARASRPTGDVISGPAESPLAARELTTGGTMTARPATAPQPRRTRRRRTGGATRAADRRRRHAQPGRQAPRHHPRPDQEHGSGGPGPAAGRRARARRRRAPRRHDPPVAIHPSLRVTAELVSSTNRRAICG